MVEAHSSGTLHYRFKDQGGQLVLMFADYRGQRLYVGRVPLAVEGNLRRGSKIAYRQGGSESAVHTRDGVADAHGVPRVAVVAAADGDEVGFPVVARTGD